jgi:hypothetical protein
VLKLVTDRTQAHVDLLKQLRKKGWANMTTSERAAWEGEAAKGAYNCVDLNRVEAVCSELADAFGLSLATKTNWQWKDIPTKPDMERYLNNVALIRDHCATITDISDYPTLPNTMENLTVEDANNIERVLELAWEHAPLDYPSIQYLFDNGNGFPEIGGEWEAIGFRGFNSYASNENVAPTMSLENGELVGIISATNTTGNSSTFATGIIRKVDRIDFTPYTRLKATFSEVSYENKNIAQYGVWVLVLDSLETSKGFVNENIRAANRLEGTDLTFDLSIDTLFGEYYVAIGYIARSVDDTPVTLTAKLKSMWLE